MRLVAGLDGALAGARAPHAVCVVVGVVGVNLIFFLVVVVLVVGGDGVFDAVGEAVAVQRLGHVLVFGDRCQEALVVVFARRDWALLGALVQVSEHMRLEVLEDATTLWEGAQTLLPGLVVELVAAATTLAAGARMLRVEGSI